MPEHSLHGFRIDLSLVHKPVAEAVTQVVKAEALTVCNRDADCSCRDTKMVFDEGTRVDRHLAVCGRGGENEILALGIRAAVGSP